MCCLRGAGDRRLRGKRNAVQAVQRRLARLPLLCRISPLAEPLVSLRPERRFVVDGAKLPAGLWRARNFHAYLQRRLARHDKPVCGNKITTDSIATIYRLLPVHGEGPGVDRYEELRRARLNYFFNTLFAEYRLLFISRDGRSVVQSKVRRERATQGGAVTAWLESARIHAALREAAGDRLLTIRFEDLVTRPYAVLTRACEFLGEAFDEQMLAGAERLYEYERNPGFNLDRIAVPQDARLSAQLSEGLLHFGYLLDPAPLPEGAAEASR